MSGRDSADAELDFRVTLQLIYKETAAYLERLARAASEGRAIDEANNYLRWLQFSSVLRLLEKNSYVNPDFVKLRYQCEALQAICRPYLQGSNIPASPSQARIDELNDKVDIILAAMAKNISPSKVHTADAGRPALTVIAGGASSPPGSPPGGGLKRVARLVGRSRLLPALPAVVIFNRSATAVCEKRRA